MAYKSNAWELLGLPDPRSVTLNDPKLARLYQDFCKQLCGDSLVVYANNIEFLSITQDDHQANKTKVELLSALRRPRRKEIAKMRQLRHKYITYAIRVEASDTFPDTQWLQLIDAYENFKTTSDCKKLTAGRTPSQSIATLESWFSNAPGYCWSSSIDVVGFNSSWSAVYFRGDCEDNVSNAFPWPVGFCRRKHLNRSLATLLDFKNYQCGAWDNAANTIAGPINDLVEVCWCRFGENEDTYGEFFLQFTDDQLDIFREVYGSLTSRDLIDQLLELRIKFDLDLADVVNTYGPPHDGSYLKNIEQKLTVETA